MQSPVLSMHADPLVSGQFMERSPWEMGDFKWDSAPSLNDDEMDIAEHLAGQGSYAEETGMLIAAKLVRCIEDRDARRLLGQQAGEEARHSEVFERYAQVRFGSRAPTTAAQPGVDMLTRLEDIDDPFKLFITHTLFEGFALDEFSFLMSDFQDELLSSIYKAVRSDEANHVSMGIAYLRRELPRLTPSRAQELDEWCLGAIPQLAWIQGIVSLVEMTGPQRRDSDIAGLLTARYENRLQQIFSTSSRRLI